MKKQSSQLPLLPIFLFNRKQSYLIAFLLLTVSTIPSILVSAEENKIITSPSSSIDVAIDPYPGVQGVSFFKSDIQQKFYQPEIISTTPLSKEGVEKKKELLKVLEKLQESSSPDSHWINATLKSEIKGKALKIVFVPNQDLRNVTAARYLPELHVIEINMDYYTIHKNEFWHPGELEQLLRHELWHCRQWMLNEAINPTMDPISNFQSLTPFHNEEYLKRYLTAIHQDMRSVDEFKNRLLQGKLTKSDKKALAHYPLSYKKMTADKERKTLRKVGDTVTHNGYPLHIVEIRHENEIDRINFEITCPYYSFLYDYEQIQSRIDRDYQFESMEPRKVAQYEKAFRYKYHPVKWHVEFDAYITEFFPPKVLKKFFKNRAAYHQAREELAKQDSASKNDSFKI